MEDLHWEKYYQGQALKIAPPSQFAAFVASEYIKNSQVFDLGCGNGRDTFFFANFATRVFAVDGSHAAIRVCEEIRNQRDVSAVTLINSRIEADSLAVDLENRRDPSVPAVIYSRFFLHAITDKQEDALFELIRRLCSQHCDRVALEFRTVRDRDLPKQTASHFRRYVDPANVIARAVKCGFSVEYFVEGFGFAKYLADDAYVARLILKIGE